LGGNDQEFREFAPGIYDYCKKLDLQPDKITPLLKEIFVLSKSVPVSQIPEYIQQQISRKSEVESEAKRRGSEPLKEEGMTLEDVNQFRSFMTELWKNGLSIGNKCYVWRVGNRIV
jgi:hypothetical protein